MTRRSHDQVDDEDLAEGFGLIVPGDARHSDYRWTDAEGKHRPPIDLPPGPEPLDTWEQIADGALRRSARSTAPKAED